jgi:hypothetical protein
MINRTRRTIKTCRIPRSVVVVLRETGSALCKLVVNPDPRPTRLVGAAVVKRRPKNYDRMTRPRDELRRRLLEGMVAA